MLQAVDGVDLEAGVGFDLVRVAAFFKAERRDLNLVDLSTFLEAGAYAEGEDAALMEVSCLLAAGVEAEGEDAALVD
jgi:hypothetical protein